MNKILEVKFGSHLYGTNTEKSDLDFKGIYLPSAKEICLGKYKKTISTTRPKGKFERNTKDDIDIEIFSLDRYLELLAEGQIVALDILFAPDNFINDNSNGLWKLIKDNKEKILTRNVNAFLGYAKQQAARYGVKGTRLDSLKRTVSLLDTLPLRDKLNIYESQLNELVSECSSFVSLEKTPLVQIVEIPCGDKKILIKHLEVCNRKLSFTATVKTTKDVFQRILDEYGSRAHKANLSGGKDYKALSHAVRVNSQAYELLTTNHITFPRPDSEILIKIKKEEMPYEQIAELIEEGVAKVHDVHLKSTLRDVPDQEWIDNLIFNTYSDIIRKND